MRGGSDQGWRAMKHKHISLIVAVLVVVCYIGLALAAFVRYPTSYSPVGNWLSDLGSAHLNPRDAFLYNTGIVLAGLLLIPFFFSLVSVRILANRKQRAILMLTQVFGLLGSLSLLMSGMFPINFMKAHQLWSISLYVTLGTSFAFSIAALRYHRSCPRLVLYLGGLTAGADILSGILQTTYALEWITVALFLCYLCVLGAQAARLSAVASSRTPAWEEEAD
jgi:hypothetical membrane protein